MERSIARLSEQRQQLIRRLFPSGVPTLWCPLLTHFSSDGVPDKNRTLAHLQSLLPWIKGFLISGSTGEGWEISDAYTRICTEIAIEAVAGKRAHLLIGVLKTNTADAAATISRTMERLASHASADALSCLSRSSLCGFTVCPPSGKDRSQEEIVEGLTAVLARGYPTALYQLPQVTHNEIALATATTLAEQFDNFYLLKDSSGSDQIATSGFRPALLLRGAEGGHIRHYTRAGGNYDGFLLSTANCLAPQLATLIEQIDRGSMQAAEHLSTRLTAVTANVFSLSAQVPYGNVFTNANKAMDHYFAHGPRGLGVAPPLLHSGQRLPNELIAAVGDALRRFDLMPVKGYL